MPMLKRPDAEIYYEIHGSGFPEHAQVTWTTLLAATIRLAAATALIAPPITLGAAQAQQQT